MSTQKLAIAHQNFLSLYILSHCCCCSFFLSLSFHFCLLLLLLLCHYRSVFSISVLLVSSVSLFSVLYIILYTLFLLLWLCLLFISAFCILPSAVYAGDWIIQFLPLVPPPLPDAMWYCSFTIMSRQWPRARRIQFWNAGVIIIGGGAASLS